MLRDGYQGGKGPDDERLWDGKGRCPLLGHLLMILVRGFPLRGAIELQDGVDTDFPDSLGEGGLLCAGGQFALVFLAAEFALDMLDHII